MKLFKIEVKLTDYDNVAVNEIVNLLTVEDEIKMIVVDQLDSNAATATETIYMALPEDKVNKVVQIYKNYGLLISSQVIDHTYDVYAETLVENMTMETFWSLNMQNYVVYSLN